MILYSEVNHPEKKLVQRNAPRIKGGERNVAQNIFDHFISWGMSLSLSLSLSLIKVDLLI